MQNPLEKTVQYAESFDGRFPFTNWTSEDFEGKWNGKIYRFPAETTSPIVIPTATLEETQNIRKKFAKDLAVREFYKSQALKSKESPVGQGESLHSALTYTDKDLEQYIQKCLEPLALAHAAVADAPKQEINLSVDPKTGKSVTTVIDESTSLVGQGQVIA